MTLETCEHCHQKVSTSSRPLQNFLVGLGIVLALLSFAGVGVLRDTIVDIHAAVNELSRTSNATQPPAPAPAPAPAPIPRESRCAFPIVYNKPHKTASTKIQADIFLWGSKVRRHVYYCSGFINQAIMQMRECIPTDASGCAVIASHVILSPTMTSILEEKIGKFAIVTSTRNPRDRLLSHYFQMRGTDASRVASNSTDLLEFMRRVNPWALYNYHTGGNRVGGCPLTEAERLLIPEMVNRAAFVIDVTLFNVSQAILRANGLFPLTDTDSNVRNATDFRPNAEIEQAIRDVACVEEEMHRLYRLRIASLYQKATEIEDLVTRT